MSTQVQFSFRTLSEAPARPLPGPVPVRGWLGWIRGQAARWRERRLLEQLDDRALRDIGISRSEALAEARKPFWQR